MNSENSDNKPTNFIRNIINEDLTSGKHISVITRFPPDRMAIFISVMQSQSVLILELLKIMTVWV